MSDALLASIASNVALSTALALTAWIVQGRERWATVAHLLWIAALVKLVTPPLMTLPLWPLSADVMSATDTKLSTTNSAVGVTTPRAPLESLNPSDVAGWVWLIGGLAVLSWSLLRIARFERLLRCSSRDATPVLSAQMRRLCGQLKLTRPPRLHLTSARMTPLVWWLGGRPRVYLPEGMLTTMQPEQLRWILAHELAHIRRGDHYVRWIEWLTCATFWWNPVSWWARRNLRKNEEICCDALVLHTLSGSRHDYANSLLAAVEFLAAPGSRPPATASEINSGGFLKRRFEMIVSKTPVKTSPRWLQFAAATFAALTLPLGVTYAQNTDVRAVAERLEKAVKAGEMSQADMDAVLRALKQQSAKKGAPRRAQKDGAKKGRQQNPEAEAQRALEMIRRRMRAAVEAGKMTEEEAAKAIRSRMADVEARMKKAAKSKRGRGDAAENMRREHEAFVREMGEMVKAGKLSREEMEEKVAAHRRGIAEKMRGAEAKKDRSGKDGIDARLERLKKAVDNGDISPAEAEARYDALMKYAEKNGAGRKQGKQKAEASSDDFTKRLERAVKNGDMTEEQAKKRYMERETGAGAKKGRQKKDVQKKGGRGGDVTLEAMRKRLDGAVERGMMTKKEAKERLKAFRMKMSKEKSGQKKPQKDVPMRKRRAPKRGGER
ncbi:MAG: hypothetical protein CMJ88_05560 [Planctomycetes bacterium]|nr:hypothetical protein [Planctomycetota bacterium]